MDDPAPHERWLHRAVLAGDEEAWRAWYDAVFPSLDAYVRWRCGGRRDLAEEILQETWVVAVGSLRRFDADRGTFLGWLRGIAAGLLANRLRKDRRRRELQAELRPREESREAADRERAEAVAHALASLPDHYEAVLRAKYLDGLSVAEIADSSGEGPKTVESLLTRAREAFRRAWNDAFGADEKVREVPF